ncbi:MAG TPA: alpha/beta fold hydrolase, partial [Aggregatilineales bacterium]|nr:alpha/beta fold hydrolase [Aggregatilineales bacterium]
MPTQFLTLTEGKLAYDDQGTGPLVLCVPGLGDLRAEYRFLAPRLAEAGYRVITMDVRGHGATSAQWPDYRVEAVGSDILALIRHLD